MSERIDRLFARCRGQNRAAFIPYICAGDPNFARTVEIAHYLIDRGAEIDVRDVDHESTPAQYLVREAPDVARLLVDRGAWYDIFIAVGLRDGALVERCLQNDREALDHRTWQGKYTTVHRGRPSTPEEIGDHRGDIYRWVFQHNVSVVDAARMLGFDDMVALEQWLQAAPFDRRAHERLLTVLARRGWIEEGKAHVAAACKRFVDEGLDASFLRDAWRAAKGTRYNDFGMA